MIEGRARNVDNAPDAAGDEGSFIDIGGIIRAFRRRFRLFAIVAAIVAVLVIILYFMIDPVYRATSQVEISTDKEQVVDTEQVIAGKLPDTYVVDTQVQVLKSRKIASDVVDKLKLYRDPEFVGEKALAVGTAAPEEVRRQAAVSKLLEKLRVERSGLAYVIAITFQSGNAETASRVANSVAETFVKQDLGTRVNATESATQFLQTRVAELKGQLLTSERAVQNFRAANGLLSDNVQNQSEISALSTLETELAQARGDAALQRGRAGGSSSATSDLLAQLRKQQAEVEGRIAELRQRYGDNHPDLLQALSQQRDIARQIENERQRINSSLGSESVSNSAKVGSLQSSVAQSRQQIATQNAARVRLAELEREAEATRNLYQTYLGRLRETTAQRGLESASSQLLALSTVPSFPASPSLPLFAAMAVLGGIFMGAFAVAVVEARSKGMHTVADTERALGLRSLASIPEFRSSLTPAERKQYGAYDPSFVVTRPKSGFTESFRMLRSALTDPNTHKSYQVLAITSALPREGKSSLAAAFTQVAGMDGISAILVECDTRKIGTATRPDARVGTVQVLKGKATLEEAILKDDSGAYILPIALGEEGSNLSAAGELSTLLDQLRPRFDLIVLDMAPVLPIAEARILCAYADATVFVVHWGQTTRAASSAALASLQSAGANVVGSVLSQVDLNEQRLYSSADVNNYYSMYGNYYR